MNEQARLPGDTPDAAATQRNLLKPDASGSTASPEDMRLVEALRNGDEAAFMALVEQYHMPLLRLAMLYLPDRALAEEVVQETWIGVLQGIHRFEGRSSLKTWIFRILMNRARTHAQREGRSVPFSSLADFSSEAQDGQVDADLFVPAEHLQGAGGWISPPSRWEDVPEDHLLSQETRGHIEQAVQALPANQRAVITLHDIEGCPSEEIRNLLGISAVNQRVLLHRARAQVRRALEQYLKEE
jgi:RNA polymerase sigma-70 factor (ECF subfamily)